jgi:hypothetical protein
MVVNMVLCHVQRLTVFMFTSGQLKCSVLSLQRFSVNSGTAFVYGTVQENNIRHVNTYDRN